MLNEIREKLESLDMGPVQYGRITSIPDERNYIVFGRRDIRPSGTSKTDYNRYYTVVLVHEDYIPEGAEFEVKKKLEEIRGLRMAKEKIQYDYAVKKNSQTVVEMAVLIFTEVIKGYEQ